MVNYGAQMSSREKGRFGKEHVLRDSRTSNTCKATVAGRDLYRYSVRWQGRFVEWALANEMYGPRHPSFFERPKFMIRDITGTHRIELTLDLDGLYCDHTILCAQLACDAAEWRDCSPPMIQVSREYRPTLVLGLLASRLVSAYYYLTLTGEGVRTGGGFHTYPKTIRALPIFDVSRANKSNNQFLARIADLAERMLDMHKSLAAAKTAHAKTALRRQIDTTDRQIDQLVYELYGLTDDEIRIVEEATQA